MYLITFVALVICYPFDKKRFVVHKISKWLTDSFFGFGLVMKRKVEGIENLDPKGTYVMVLNHNSMIDILSIYNLPLVFKWVSKKEVYRIPIVGRLLLAHGDIVINRASTKEAMQLVHTRGMEWLKKGASVAIFPEGTRSKNGELGEFRGGAMKVAMETGALIVPVLIEGSRERLEETGNVTAGTVYVTFLDPIETEGMTKEEFFDMPPKLRALIQAERDRQRSEK
jgi:1-acyl-sn-glycerol-3-phosphate acyltransferase